MQLSKPIIKTNLNYYKRKNDNDNENNHIFEIKKIEKRNKNYIIKPLNVKMNKNERKNKINNENNLYIRTQNSSRRKIKILDRENYKSQKECIDKSIIIRIYSSNIYNCSFGFSL